MNNLFIYIILLLLLSCGYPDIDTVPDFRDVNLTSDEIIDYCSNSHTIKKNIEKCVNDYKSKK